MILRLLRFTADLSNEPKGNFPQRHPSAQHQGGYGINLTSVKQVSAAQIEGPSER